MHRAVIVVELKSSKGARALYSSLKPEASSMARRGFSSSVDLSEEGSPNVSIFIEAPTLSRLRAALNSYLRWLSSFKEASSLILGEEL